MAKVLEEAGYTIKKGVTDNEISLVFDGENEVGYLNQHEQFCIDFDVDKRNAYIWNFANHLVEGSSFYTENDNKDHSRVILKSEERATAELVEKMIKSREKFFFYFPKIKDDVTY